MKLVADLHIHSHFSRATSPNLTFEHLTRWAQLKGIHVVGTGDIAHPGWLAEMREKLEPGRGWAVSAEATIWRPRSRLRCRRPATRRCASCWAARSATSTSAATGRARSTTSSLRRRSRRWSGCKPGWRRSATSAPTAGPSSAWIRATLLEIVLDTDPACHLIPAHIWTPWFSLLGSKSGFDSVAECFADLTPHIFALETGLSSDPPMNWRVSALDRYTLVSNSDAHSPEKLGREATLFDCELAYGALFEALSTRGASPRPRTGEGPGVRATSAPSNSSPKKANTTSTAIAPAASSGIRRRRAPTTRSARSAASR